MLSHTFVEIPTGIDIIDTQTFLLQVWIVSTDVFQYQSQLEQ